MTDRGSEILPTPPTSAHLLVCVDARCAAHGGRELHGALWDALERERLSYYQTGGTIRLTASSCLGACDSGPTMACYANDLQTGTLAATWLGRQNLESALVLARSMHRPSRER